MGTARPVSKKILSNILSKAKFMSHYDVIIIYILNDTNKFATWQLLEGFFPSVFFSYPQKMADAQSQIL